MTTEQKNRLAMFNATHALLDGAPETSGIPAFAARFGTFSTKLEQLAEFEAQQADPLRSQIILRDAALSRMIHATLALGGSILSHADAHGLPSLALRVRYTPADFDRVRMAQRPVLAQQIVDAAKTVLAQSAEHGVTQAIVDDAEALIAAAAAEVAASRTTVAAKRAATERLALVFREIGSVLDNQLDPLVFPLQQTNPAFHARYLAVRETVNRPATRATAADAAASVAPAVAPTTSPAA
jgi:hypothetical protein